MVSGTGVLLPTFGSFQRYDSKELIVANILKGEALWDFGRRNQKSVAWVCELVDTHASAPVVKLCIHV